MSEVVGQMLIRDTQKDTFSNITQVAPRQGRKPSKASKPLSLL